MRLFFALCRKRMPNGHIFRGKDRLVKPVELSHISKLRHDLEIEERNMFLLRHAYLTPEQSHGHAQALGRTKEAMFTKRILQRVKPFKENVTIEGRLAHLRHTESWDN